mmetsp:Transcript_9772/g.19236  ORF Transcript_9772/g.19236 Transcript_9772/m.19236 type:complete len:213 (+) Transcript_9772:189-827(+)
MTAGKFYTKVRRIHTELRCPHSQLLLICALFLAARKGLGESKVPHHHLTGEYCCLLPFLSTGFRLGFFRLGFGLGLRFGLRGGLRCRSRVQVRHQFLAVSVDHERWLGSRRSLNGSGFGLSGGRLCLLHCFHLLLWFHPELIELPSIAKVFDVARLTGFHAHGMTETRSARRSALKAAARRAEGSSPCSREASEGDTRSLARKGDGSGTKSC